MTLQKTPSGWSHEAANRQSMPTTAVRSPRSPFDRPRWTLEDGREVIAALNRSGKSVSVFSAEHGLDPQRVYLWRRRLVAAVEPAAFREVVVQPAARRPSVDVQGAPFEIALTSGQVVRVPASFDAAALARLLDVLAQAGAC
jgi:transposase-like protein